MIQNAAPLAELGVATSVSQFSRQIGSTVGVAIFGTLLTHHLTLELPKHVPLLPGLQQQSLDLSHAQSQAMDPKVIRQRVASALDERYRVVERAYWGEPAAAREIIADSRLLEQIKGPLREGGIANRVHRELLQRADGVESALHEGALGRARLLADPSFSPALRLQLADLPERALRDPESLARVATLFRESILAQEQAQVTVATQSALARIKAGMQVYGRQLAAKIHSGIREAFSTSITTMLARSLWIVVLGLLIILLLPEVPLRSRVERSASGPSTGMSSRERSDLQGDA